MSNPPPRHDRDPRIGQPAPHRTEDFGTDTVQPVHVINHQHDRLRSGRDRQQIQYRRHQRHDRHLDAGIAAQNRRQHGPVGWIAFGQEPL